MPGHRRSILKLFPVKMIVARRRHALASLNKITNGCFYNLRAPAKRSYSAPQRGAGFIPGRLRADPYKNYIAASMNWRSSQSGCSHEKSPAIKAPDFGKLPNTTK